MIASFISKWRWLALALLFMSLFSSLGLWQWQRAESKEILLQQFAARKNHTALHAANLSPIKDLRFYPVQLKGKYDNARTFYLDNKIYKGRAGYEIYTPFMVKGLEQAILVDRGWVPVGQDRAHLPDFPKARGTSINGTLNLPPTYFALGPMQEKTGLNWPLRIEFIDLQTLSKLLGYPVFSYVLWLDSVPTPTWQVVTTKPEKHRGYAVQWFAFALTVLILYVVLNRPKGIKR